MSLAAAIRAELVSHTASAIYVAGVDGAPDRVYPVVIPQKVPNGAQVVPAVVMSVGTVDRSRTQCGTIALVRTRVTLDCYATTYAEAHDLAAAVRQVLIDFRGELGQQLTVKDAALQNEIDLSDIEPGLYRVSQDWEFWHVE